MYSYYATCLVFVLEAHAAPKAVTCEYTQYDRNPHKATRSIDIELQHMRTII